MKILFELIQSIKSLKIYKLMNGFRGVKRVNIEKLAKDILKIASLVKQKNQSFSSIEINPLFVYSESTCAIDAVIACNNS